MADLLTVPAGNLVKAEGLSIDACAAVEFLAIGAHAVRRAAPAAGSTALVVGAGPIGLGAALFARLSGAEVAITDMDPDRSAQVAALAGVSAVPPSDLGDYDTVLDATGSRAAMEASFDRVASGGTLAFVGVMRENISFSDPDFHRKEMTLIASRNATRIDFDRVIAAIRDGEIDIDRVLTHRTTLTDAARDLARWATEKTGLIKAVIEID